jgi:3-hydroxyisobutyrate dehydrogenase-like beta-hydroxyacid dehydrogenase
MERRSARSGVVSAAHPGLLAIDSSTIGPSDTVAIGADLAARRIAMLDAPVTGSSPAAESGTLTIMVGGADADYERALPILQAMGEVIVHVGELGQGQMLKLVNNALAAANASALAEALVLASAKGVDLDAFERIVGAGSGGSFQLQLKGRPMREHDFTTLFKTAHMLKDVRLCLQESDAAGVPFPTAAHARDLLDGAMGRGRADDDYSSLLESVEGLADRRL